MTFAPPVVIVPACVRWAAREAVLLSPANRDTVALSVVMEPFCVIPLPAATTISALSVSIAAVDVNVALSMTLTVSSPPAVLRIPATEALPPPMTVMSPPLVFRPVCMSRSSPPVPPHTVILSEPTEKLPAAYSVEPVPIPTTRSPVCVTFVRRENLPFSM